MKGMKSMLAVSEHLIVHITDFAHDGSGIGCVDRLAVFVPGALPGEQVEVVNTVVKRKYAMPSFFPLRKSVTQG